MAPTDPHPPTDLRRHISGFLSPKQALRINNDEPTLLRFIRGIPKAELHLHIEGTLEPSLQLAIAKRNGLSHTLEGYSCYDGDEASAGSDADWCKAQNAKRRFQNLQEFLDLYYSACDVLRTEQDFFDLAFAYFTKASESRVVRAEVFFDPQTHTIERNTLPLETVINGLYRACKAAKTQLSPPVDAHLIMCFLRHRHPGCSLAQPPAMAGEALQVLEDALQGGHRDKLLGIGLDSSEEGNPPALFEDVFARAREAGLRLCAHAGEEGPASWVTEALDVLKVERVDHGVRSLEDPAVLKRLADNKTPLKSAHAPTTGFRYSPPLHMHREPAAMIACVCLLEPDDVAALREKFIRENGDRFSRGVNPFPTASCMAL
eukprot:CAMPEP_0117680384 /NCGR_PEP_ID=MMETSP0804-20121206/18323_1 /TAXON_ID=1074897 /ORGANISM="Tetraselmis astigmatica, Strain CCMP880" /LENGTH=374 /DNA_ID=CAMNT_0005489877 /DNA_START=119 /DNA_END=1244 /DNA_ORIENTATION=+